MVVLLVGAGEVGAAAVAVEGGAGETVEGRWGEGMMVAGARMGEGEDDMVVVVYIEAVLDCCGGRRGKLGCL